MAIREIVTVPAQILKRPAHKVNEFGPDLQKLVDDMVETMREAPGVGLAAPQINVPWRVIVIEYGDEQDENAPLRLFAMVNPEITKSSNDAVMGTEGCLSIPGYVGDVERSSSILVKGFNRHGQPMKVKAKGWLARIFQHEVDHLNGILFTDRTESIHELKPEDAKNIPLD